MAQRPYMVPTASAPLFCISLELIQHLELLFSIASSTVVSARVRV
jgi:hypothetical protein